MGVFFIDIGVASTDDIREKITTALVAQGCWAREDCADGIALRTDLPKGLKIEDVRRTMDGSKEARDKVARLVSEEMGNSYQHPKGFFWHLDGFLVYQRDPQTSRVTITTLDDHAEQIGSVSEDAKRVRTKWGLKTLVQSALKPLWRRFVP